MILLLFPCFRETILGIVSSQKALKRNTAVFRFLPNFSISLAVLKKRYFLDVIALNLTTYTISYLFTNYFNKSIPHLRLAFRCVYEALKLLVSPFLCGGGHRHTIIVQIWGMRSLYDFCLKRCKKLCGRLAIVSSYHTHSTISVQSWRILCTDLSLSFIHTNKW